MAGIAGVNAGVGDMPVLATSFDFYQNKDIVSSPTAELLINRNLAKLVTVDEIAVRFEFKEP